MELSRDIKLNEEAFNTASEALITLKTRTEALKETLESMYLDLTTALVTPAGNEVKKTAKSVLIDPIDKLLLVIGHISDTLTKIIGTEYYKDVFSKFEELNESIKF